MSTNNPADAQAIGEVGLPQAGPPCRLRDLIALTGLSSATVRQDIRQGELMAHQRLRRPNSPYFISREQTRRWLRQLGAAF